MLPPPGLELEKTFEKGGTPPTNLQLEKTYERGGMPRSLPHKPDHVKVTGHHLALYYELREYSYIR